MLNKEIRSVARIVLFWFGFFLLALAVNAVDLWVQSSWGAWGERFFISLQVFLLLYPLFLGLSLFMEESRQKGMEYLLTLPYSRARILWFKLAPRLAALAGMSLIFSGVYAAGSGSFLSYNWYPFTLVYIILFCLSLTISLGLESSLVSIAAAFLTSLVYFTLVATACAGALLVFRLRGDHRLAYSPFDSIRNYIGNLLGDSDFFPGWILPVVLVILLFPFFLAFFHSIRRLDLRTARIGGIYLKRFFQVLAAALPLAAFLIVFSFKSRLQSEYYLAAGLQVIECRRNQLIIHYPKRIRKHRIKEVAQVKPVIDHQGWLYLTGSEKEYEGSIWRIELRSGRIEKIHQAQGERGHINLWNFILSDDSLSFVQIDFDSGRFFPDYSLGVIDLSDLKFQKYPLPRNKEKKTRYNRMIAADVCQGTRYWLLSSWSREADILRIWQDGRQEFLEGPCSPAVYRRPFLASFRDGGIECFDMSASLPRRAGEIPGRYFPIYRFGFVADGGALSHRVLVQGPDKSNALCLDLGKSSILPVEDFKKTAQIWALGKDRYYFILDRLEKMDAVRLENCRFRVLKRFDRKTLENLHENFFDSPHGLVVKEKGRVRAYAYPDLREIKFK